MCCQNCFEGYVDRTIYNRFRMRYRTGSLLVLRTLSFLFALQTFLLGLFMFPPYLAPLSLSGILCLCSLCLFGLLFAQHFTGARGWQWAVVFLEFTLAIFIPSALLFWVVVVMGNSSSFPCLNNLRYHLDSPGRIVYQVELNMVLPLLILL